MRHLVRRGVEKLGDNGQVDLEVELDEAPTHHLPTYLLYRVGLTRAASAAQEKRVFDSFATQSSIAVSTARLIVASSTNHAF